MKKSYSKKNDSTNNKRLLVKFVSFAVCFAFIFSLTMLLNFGVFDDLFVSNNLNDTDIAEALWGKTLLGNKDAVVSNSKIVNEPTSGFSDSQNMNFPGGTSVTQWTNTETIKRDDLYGPDGNNFTAAIWSEAELGTPSVGKIDHIDVNGQFPGYLVATQLTNYNILTRYESYIVFNYEISPFIRELASNPNFKVTATYNSVFNSKDKSWNNNNGDKFVYRFESSNNKLVANTVDSKDMTPVDGTGASVDITATTELKPGTNYLNIVNGLYDKNAPNSLNSNDLRFIINQASVTYKVEIRTDSLPPITVEPRDGGSPKLQLNLDRTTPFLPNGLNGNGWVSPDNAKDTNHASNIKLMSYVNKIQNDPIVDEDTNYYKKTSISIIDTFRYGFQKESQSSLQGYDNKMSLGIQNIKIGDSTVDISASSNLNKKYTLFVEGANVGSFVIKQGFSTGGSLINSYGNNAYTVDIYFNKNTFVYVTASDFGDLQSTASVEVSGIDTTPPNMLALDVSNRDLTANIATDADWDKIIWRHAENLYSSVISNNDEAINIEGISEYIWYYDVAKSKDGKFSEVTSISPTNLLSKRAYAYNSISNFEYNFINGHKVGKEPISVQDDLDKDTATVKGNGYYRFTFYVADMAGNVIQDAQGNAEYINYYTKVDTSPVTHSISYEFGERKIAAGSNVGTLTTNGIWATEELSIVIKITQEDNVSGFVLTFPDLMGRENTLAVQKNMKGNYAIVSVNGEVPASEPIIIGNDNIGIIKVFFDHVKKEFILIYGSDNNILIDMPSSFKIQTGIDANHQDVLENKDSNWKYQSGNAVSDGTVHIRFDGKNPELAIIENDYITNGDTIPASNNRNWYTDKWEIDLMASFSDENMLKYGDEIFVYIATSFDSFSDSIVDTYKNIKSLEDAQSQNIKYLKKISLSEFVNNSAEISLRLNNPDADRKAGLRGIYVWTVDQAGNVSDNISENYIMVDANRYALKATASSSSLQQGDAPAVLPSFTNENGKVLINPIMKRGDKISLNFDSTSKYIAYKLNRQNGAQPTMTIARNNTANDILISDNNYTSVRQGSTTTDILLDMDLYNKNLYDDLDGTVHFTYMYRELINYTVTNTNVSYTGNQVDVPISLNNPDNKNQFFFKFYTDYECKKEFNQAGVKVPTIPGIYYLKIGVDTENTGFLTSNNIEPIEFKIINKNVLVQVVTQQSYFGDIVDNDTLTFTVDGLNESEVTLVAGSLKIVNDFDTSNLGVGSYTVVQDETFDIEYHNLTFIAGIHNIIPKNIGIDIITESKTYGDYDPTFSFEVDTTQFKSGHSFDDVFYNVVSNNSMSTIITLSGFAGGQVLQRTAGEDVGEYVFSDSLTLLDYNQNYNINVNNLADAKFTVNPRQIYINPLENQTLLLNIVGSDIEDNKGDIVGTYIDSVVKLSDEFINNLNYKYSVNQSDLAFSDEIQGDLKLTYSINIVDNPVNGYLYSVYVPADISSIETSKNITIAMTRENEKCQFVIVIENGQVNTINISIKPNIVFERNYGDDWSETEIDFSSSQFDMTGISDAHLADYILTWKTSVETPLGSLPEVGVHQVIVEEIKIMSDGIDVSGEYEFIVAPFFAEFLPVVVIVNPTSTKNNKIYGESDSVYGISHLLSESFKNNYEDVSGSFARAVFARNGDFVRFASRFDIPTDSNGNLIDGSGEYYGLVVATPFVYSSINSNRYSFSVDTDVLNSFRFVVEKKNIVFDSNNLIGISKNYDGTDVVKYPSDTIAYDISQMKINIDDAIITFVATYDSHEVGERKINFTNIQIVGDDALKYSLVDDLGNAITIDSVVTIDSIDKNAQPIEKIKIYNVTSFNISRVDIIFQKEYDGNTLVTAENIKISSANILSELELQLVEGDVFNFKDKNVHNNEVFANFKFFFPMNNPKNWAKSDENSDKDITISFVTSGNNKGIYVEIKNIVGAILPKQLVASDFISIDGIDRDYDATVDVGIVYKLNVDATVGADRLELDINAQAKNKNTSASRVSVSFTSYVSSNKNYAVDINNLNSVYGGLNSLNILISKKQIKIDAIFNPNKIYNGESVLTKQTFVGGDSYSINKQIVPYFVSKMEVNNELAILSYNWNDVNLHYTSYDKDNNAINDANVVFDENGNVVKHDVRIDSLIISTNSVVDIGELFSNYYIDNAKISRIDNNSITFDAFVMESVATLNRKSVGLADETAVKVYDKIYDGEVVARVSAQIDNNEIVVADRNKIGLSLYGEFIDKNVGNNIPVKIFTDGIVDLYDKQNIAKNYILSDKMPHTLYAEIKPRPITFTTDSGSKVYDDISNIDINHITTQVDGVFDNENYVIEFVAGRYEDENSSWNTDTEVYERKKSYLYGAKLINQFQRDLINYKLTEKGALDDSRDLYAVQLTSGEFVIASIFGSEVLDIYGQAVLNTDIEGYYYNLKYEKIDLDDDNGEILMSVVESSGIITRDNLILGIKILTGSDKTTKDYDASKNYLGMYGIDFKIVDSYGNDLIYSNLEEVVFDAKYVTAEYDDANSGVRTIVFNIDTKGLPIDFYNSQNYKSALNSSMEAQGLIKKISIDSLLSETTVEYGFDEISLENSVTYSSTFGGENKLDLVKALLNGQVKLFVVQAQYKEAFPSDIKYADNTKYVIKDGIALDIPANNDSTIYVPLKGLFELPVADSASNQYTPAGDATLKMRVVDQTRTTNFTYNISYDLDGTESKLIIQKTDLYVFASQIVYNQVYGGVTPKIVIDFYGNKNGDTDSQIFDDKKIATAVFKLFDGLVWQDEISPTSKILTDVEIQAGQFYGAFISIDSSVLLDNYNLVLRYDPTDAKDVDSIPKLDIVLPTISDVELFDKTVIYNASEQHLAIVSGVMVGDIVTYELKVGNDWVSFVDGEFPTDVRFDIDGKVVGYEIRIKIKRAIANDSNGYFYQDYVGSAVLTIKQARLGISADDFVALFDFETKIFNKDIIEFKFDGEGLKDLVNVKFEIEKATGFVECAEILRAGIYRINIIYAPTENSNFENEQAESYYNVKPITFNVAVTPSDLKQEYVAGNIPVIRYKSELIEEFSDVDPLKIPGTKIVFMSELVSSGVYRYEVVANGVEHPTDYLYIGQNKGSIILGKSTVFNGNNSSVSLSSGEIFIADSLSWNEVKKDTQTEFDGFYWNIVNSHMARISEENNKHADLMSVVQISLINNGVKIQPDEEVIVKVKVPDSAKDVNNLIVYAVTESGQLKSINYNIVDGYVVYKTNFIEALVFVELGALQTLEIVAIALGVTVIVLGMLAGIFVGLKIKNKKKCS